MPAAKTNTELLIDNAVLRSSNAFRKELDETLEKQQGKTEKLIRDLTDEFTTKANAAISKAEEAKDIAEDAHNRIKAVWAKVISLTAAAAVLGGFVSFLITQLSGKG